MNLNSKLKNPAEKLNTYFEKTQQELFHHLRPISIPNDEKGESEKMPAPYSGKNIPWPTFIGPEFFTLSTNKKKSDKILCKFRCIDGSVIEVPLTRGKISPDSKEEFGIPDVQHGRIFSALELIWAEKGCPYIRFKDGTLICHVIVSSKELAKKLGWKNWQHLSKDNLRWLRDKIAKLKSMPYYLHLEELNLKWIKGYGFYLIGDAALINKKARRGEETIFRVYFSSSVSWQLLQKHAVIRPKEMLSVHSELAFLLWLYLEPNLRSHNEVCINLSNLIKILHLPEAKWQKHKGKRKQIFEKAIKEINEQRLADNRKMVVKIEKGLYDWQLVAHLEGYSIKLPGESQHGN
ncbi:MAG: hypothetical protein J7L42_01890 [Elusimicrobia bacterium]|nr:hypothetical protein [Elusimicrobiota bacterium]